MMKMMVYDGTFGGFLSAIFDMYEYKFADAKIVKQSIYNASVFGQDHVVETNDSKALRVWKG